MAGYSATPLAKKLGLKNGFVISLVNPPAHYHSLFTDWPEDVMLSKKVTDKKDFIHYFATSAKDLQSHIALLKSELKPAGMLWVSWPKKSSGVTTEVNENLVREAGLNTGLVDIKVCAVDEVWSALKFVFRVKDRIA